MARIAGVDLPREKRVEIGRFSGATHPGKAMTGPMLFAGAW